MSFWSDLEQIDIISAYTTRLEHLTSLSDTIPAGSWSVMKTDGILVGKDWWMSSDGWRGLDSPEVSLPASSSSVGLGEQFLKWWPQPRDISIPLVRREDESRDALDDVLYSSAPLVLRFAFTTPRTSRFLIATHARGERQVSARRKGVIKHIVRFRSQWPFFVGAPSYQTADFTAPALQGEALWGYHVTGATIGSNYDFVVTGGSSPSTITVRADATEFLVSPSFPFEEKVVVTTGRNVPDYLRFGTSVRAVTLSGGATARLFYLPNYASLS